MEKIALFFCIFPDTYDFFNLMALQLFFQNKIQINASRLIESSEHFFLVIVRFILEKPLSATASEKVVGKWLVLWISDNPASIPFISHFFVSVCTGL